MRLSWAAQSHSVEGIDPEYLARLHRESGFNAAYVPKIDYRDSVAVKKTREAFEKEDVMLAEVGYWNNMMDTDMDTRKKHRTEMAEALYLAEEVGARCSVNVIGSPHHGTVDSGHSAWSFTQESFEETVSMAREIIDTVSPKTAYFTFEIFPFSLADSPESILELIKAVDRKQFGVHFDLVNLINSPRKYFDTEGLVKHTINLLGPYIVSGHIKDLKLEEPSISVLFHEVVPGRGNVNIGAFLREVNKLPRDIPLMLEHLTEDEYVIAADHVREVALKEGITFC